MLALAIDAQIPIIAVHTRDLLNLHEVLGEITAVTVIPWQPNVPFKKGALHTFVSGKADPPMLELYPKLVAAGASLLVVNSKDIREPMFNAGEVPVPRSLLIKFLMQVVEDQKKVASLMRGLGGVTVKEAAELARLTMARDHSLTVEGLLETRRTMFLGANGLTPVKTFQDFYAPSAPLKEWVEKEKPFFLNSKDHRLIPRGLLLDGPPGVGKTSGTKWIAEQLGVPLYRVDIGGTKSKWVGASEANLLQNFARIDAEEPAVCLLDEIEKVFSTSNHDTSGTTSTMLSQLLWWLAERRARILVVMTTNSAKSLPKELYREGRIDSVIWLGGLEKGAALKFIDGLLATFGNVKNDGSLSEAVLKMAKPIAETTSPTWAQATLTQAVYTAVKLKTKGTVK